MRKCIWFFCLLAVTATAHTWTFGQDGSIEIQSGTWTFKKGGRMDAEFQQMKGTNTVVLRRSDGEVCEVPLAVLSEADQDFVLHPPEDARFGKSKIIDEAGKIERYWRSHALNVIDDIEEGDFAGSVEVQAACNAIVADMKELTNLLGAEVTYTNFSNLLQKQALAVEKTKDTLREGLQRSFLHHADEFFRFLMNSRDDWSDEVRGKTAAYRDYCAFLRKRGWAQAKVHFLYCAGIADKSPGLYADILEAEAAIIQSEQGLARNKQNGTPYPLLHGMTLSEITDRLRSERAAVLTGGN